MVSLKEVPEGNKAEDQGEDRKQSSIRNDPMECPEGGGDHPQRMVQLLQAQHLRTVICPHMGIR